MQPESWVAEDKAEESTKKKETGSKAKGPPVDPQQATELIEEALAG